MAKEATWGTPVARTNALRCKLAGLMRDRTKEPVDHLGDIDQASTNHKHFYTTQDFAGGPLAFHMAYNDSTLMMLEQILGAVSTSAGPPYTHTFDLASPPPVGLTIEQISGTPGSGAGDNAEVFEGCKIPNATFSFDAAGILTCEAEVIAQTSQGLVAKGAPTLNTATEWIKHNHAAGLTINGVARPFQSGKVIIAREMQRNHEHGSLFTSEPYEVQLTAMLELTTLWQQGTWDAENLAETQADGSLTFTGTTSPHALVMTFQNCLVKSVKRQVGTRGAIQQTISVQLFADAANNSDQGFRMAVTNSNALSTAN